MRGKSREFKTEIIKILADVLRYSRRPSAGEEFSITRVMIRFFRFGISFVARLDHNFVLLRDTQVISLFVMVWSRDLSLRDYCFQLVLSYVFNLEKYCEELAVRVVVKIQ